ncbi:hypothetical protein [Actinomadura sp. 6K520]|jgi:hypothetical protein|uniref:hypothetical protein n=1 Tax=Actinomadura sp. 6K520 TaxID=2530364 RepID=UPI0010482997|nr:hypothetical protein [Actinomadura sp. 6K520]TDE32060.1 hypothetical protein E1289_16765 [Actinomadura sp. 6K520]
MIDNLALYLWVLVPAFVFLSFACYVLALGRSAGAQVFRGRLVGGEPTGGRSGLLVNVVVRSTAVPVMAPASAEAAVETESPVAAGARQSRVR